MGDIIGMVFSNSGKKQAEALQEQARLQQQQYQAQLREQRNSAILQGQNIAEQVATINTGGGDSYIDDPFNKRRRKTPNTSTQLGIY